MATTKRAGSNTDFVMLPASKMPAKKMPAEKMPMPGKAAMPMRKPAGRRK